MANLVEPVRTLEKVQCGGGQAELARLRPKTVCASLDLTGSGDNKLKRPTELLAAGDAWLGGRP